MSRWEVAYSHASDEWSTPRDVFRQLHEEFGFTVDACATAANARLERFWTAGEDGLAQDWRGERVWLNPPYSNVARWVEKALEAQADLVVLLVPARTCTRWWHRIAPACEVRFVRGRLRFSDGAGVAPFASAVLVLAAGRGGVRYVSRDRLSL